MRCGAAAQRVACDFTCDFTKSKAHANPVRDASDAQGKAALRSVRRRELLFPAIKRRILTRQVVRRTPQPRNPATPQRQGYRPPSCSERTANWAVNT